MSATIPSCTMFAQNEQVGWEGEAAFLSEIIETQNDLAAVELDPQVIMRMVAERIQKLTDADGASVQLLEGDWLVFRACIGIMTPFEEMRMPLAGSLAGHAASSGIPQYSPDTEKDARVHTATTRRVGVRSLITVPLMNGGQALGTINVVSSRCNAFETRHISALRLMAGLVVASLTHAAEFEVKKRLLAERTAALTSLGESEERFRSAFDNASIGMALVSLDGRWLKVNRSLCDIVGYADAELLATTFQAITHPDDLKADLANVRQLIAGGVRSYQMVKRYFHKQGQIVWILLSVSLVRDLSGKPLYFISQIRDITEQHHAEAALRSSERQFRTLASHAPVAIFEWDAAGNNVFVNERWSVMTGMTPEEARGMGWLKAVHRGDRERVWQTWQQTAAAGQPFSGEYRFLSRSGEVTWVHGASVPLRDDKGEIVGHLGTATDLTERKKAEWLENDRREVLELVARDRPLTEVLDRFVNLVERQIEDCSTAVVVLGVDGKLMLHSPTLPKSLSRELNNGLLPLVSELARSAWEGEHGIGVTDMRSAHEWRHVSALAPSLPYNVCWTIPIQSNDGTPLGLLTVCSRCQRRPTGAEVQFLHMVSQLATISIEHHRTTTQLSHLVRHDVLTGLPNRVMFEDRVQHALSMARRSGRNVAIMVLDIDRFKLVNDTLGHQAGDQLLQQFAQRLSGKLREIDTMARVGGDEFVIALPELPNRERAAIVARKMVAALVEPFELGSGPVHATTSIGIAIFPDDGDDAVTLQRKADQAVYRAKEQGRNGYSF